MTGGAVVRERVVVEAMSWVGTPYRHQASVKGVACDCLGLVRGAWRAAIGSEPETIGPYTRDWSPGAEDLHDAASRHLIEIPLSEAAAGDAVLFRLRDGLPARHAGILVGAADRPEGFRRPTPNASAFVHAWDAAGAVVVTGLAPWWRRRLVAAFVFPAGGKRRGRPEAGPGQEDTR